MVTLIAPRLKLQLHTQLCNCQLSTQHVAVSNASEQVNVVRLSYQRFQTAIS